MAYTYIVAVKETSIRWHPGIHGVRVHTLHLVVTLIFALRLLEVIF